MINVFFIKLHFWFAKSVLLNNLVIDYYYTDQGFRE